MFRVPERIIERTFVERQPVERRTEPLPIVHIEVPTQVPPQITVNLPERSKDESPVRTEVAPTDDTRSAHPERTNRPEKDVPFVAREPVQEQKPTATDAPKPLGEEQKTFDDPNKKRSDEERKTIPADNENNSPNNSAGIVSELFEPDKPTPQASSEEFEKIGPGRQRRYEELGEKDIEPIRELILFRNEFGRHWPGLSKDMEAYYERFYFTLPIKRKDGKDHAKHVKCWERRTKWLTATQSTPDSR